MSALQFSLIRTLTTVIVFMAANATWHRPALAFFIGFAWYMCILFWVRGR